MKTAFITGITGQDGSYLAELLLAKNYNVVGLIRRSSSEDPLWRHRWLGIDGKVELLEGDVTDATSVVRAIAQTEPDEVYNLAAQSFVHTSWAQPNLTAQITGVGALNVFEACRHAAPYARIYQAGSSEMFGNTGGLQAQYELTPFRPRSPYGVAKCFAHHAAVNYRESYGMFISNGILFNHESPLRGKEFVTSKVCRGAARISRGFESTLELGNLSAQRDWGHAHDYVRGMWLMLQHSEPQDFVLATGVTRSIEDLCQTAFASVGLKWQDYVTRNVELCRPAEVDVLCGDATKAKSLLKWEPEIKFGEMIQEMVNAEYGRCLKDLPCT